MRRKVPTLCNWPAREHHGRMTFGGNVIRRLSAIEKILARAAAVQRTGRAWLLFAALFAAGTAQAGLDLRNATVAELGNGMVVILLEDRNFPVASVQMLYRVGARNETAGETGLAHFLEHMAFRASENFPDTALVSSIYASGGEWHGYTWLDQTTYFATVPKEQLDLLLQIEADRMRRLELAAADMDAERGAVLAEMHMYENSPTSMLLDAVMFAAFQAHPYRNNTIGWESDIENLPHAAVVDFYEQHYHPANAVLAVVGDFDSEAVLARIDELFGCVPAQAGNAAAAHDRAPAARRAPRNAVRRRRHPPVHDRLPRAVGEQRGLPGVRRAAAAARCEFRRQLPAERLGHAGCRKARLWPAPRKT